MASHQTDSSQPNLLIVDDDETIQRLLVLATRDHGWTPVTTGSGSEAIELLTSSIRAVILDQRLPGMTGLQTLVEIRKRFPSLPVVMLTGLNDAETAVEAIRAGAAEYLTKPFELKRLLAILGQCRHFESQVREPAAKRTIGKPRPAGMRSKNPQVQTLLAHLAKAAHLDCTILLTGESGTGKTHFAREIHRLSPRRTEPFITVSCPALPHELLESELFGHERGAFTGATSARAGRFEQATQGTLFLDEVGDLPISLQPKLLTVLQDREFFRVGGSKQLISNARVITATNVNLLDRVQQGAFREDLYYRLNIIEFNIPPLRERVQDIPAFSREFLADIACKRGTDGWQLSEDAMEALCHFDWPGNIRQLQNVLERATAFCEKSELQESDIAPLLTNHAPCPSPNGNRVLTLQEVERDTFIQAYERNGRNKTRTALELGISQRSVYNLMERHGLK